MASDGQDFNVGDADYGQRVFAGGSRLTRWSHRRRAGAATGVLKRRAFSRVADVGGADGWFLRALLDAEMAESGVVVDVDEALLQAGREQSASFPSLDFVPNDSEVMSSLRGSFDLVTCLETLEHVEDPSAVLDTVVDLARPGGVVLVSVPIEVGPALLVKQMGRWVANRDNKYSYGRYPWRELVRAGVLWRTDGIGRVNLNSHKGFDFRRTRQQLRDRVSITETHWSPVRFLGPVAASTVFWLGQVPSDGGHG